MMNPSEQEWQEMQDQYGAELGDPRRCPRHPGVRMSSNDGLFDAACCDLCEGEMEDAYQAERWAAMSPEERAAVEAEAAAAIERANAKAEALDREIAEAEARGEILF